MCFMCGTAQFDVFSYGINTNLEKNVKICHGNYEIVNKLWYALRGVFQCGCSLFVFHFNASLAGTFNLSTKANMDTATAATLAPEKRAHLQHSALLPTAQELPCTQNFSVLSNQSASALPWPPYLVGQVGKPVKVALVDDDANIRHVIASELMADLRCDLVGQCGSMRDGRRLISNCEFDVILIDLNLGDGNGFELIEHLKTVRPLAEAIVISAMEDEQHALHAFQLGATGYLIKNSWFGNFSQAVLQVVNGGASITPNLARRLLQRLDHGSDASQRGEPHKKGLSDREHAVLKMVAGGYTSLEIGLRLSISGLTVNTHIKNIYRKLQVKTRAHAVSLALQRGLI